MKKILNQCDASDEKITFYNRVDFSMFPKCKYTTN